MLMERSEEVPKVSRLNSPVAGAIGSLQRRIKFERNARIIQDGASYKLNAASIDSSQELTLQQPSELGIGSGTCDQRPSLIVFFFARNVVGRSLCFLYDLIRTGLERIRIHDAANYLDENLFCWVSARLQLKQKMRWKKTQEFSCVLSPASRYGIPHRLHEDDSLEDFIGNFLKRFVKWKIQLFREEHQKKF